MAPILCSCWSQNQTFSQENALKLHFKENLKEKNYPSSEVYSLMLGLMSNISEIFKI